MFYCNPLFGFFFAAVFVGRLSVSVAFGLFRRSLFRGNFFRRYFVGFGCVGRRFRTLVNRFFGVFVFNELELLDISVALTVYVFVALFIAISYAVFLPELSSENKRNRQKQNDYKQYGRDIKQQVAVYGAFFFRFVFVGVAVTGVKGYILVYGRVIKEYVVRVLVRIFVFEVSQNFAEIACLVIVTRFTVFSGSGVERNVICRIVKGEGVVLSGIELSERRKFVSFGQLAFFNQSVNKLFIISDVFAVGRNFAFQTVFFQKCFVAVYYGIFVFAYYVCIVARSYRVRAVIERYRAFCIITVGYARFVARTAPELKLILLGVAAGVNYEVYGFPFAVGVFNFY